MFLRKDWTETVERGRRIYKPKNNKREKIPNYLLSYVLGPLCYTESRKTKR